MTIKKGFFSGWQLAILVLFLVMIIASVPAMAGSVYTSSAWPKFGYDLNNTGQSPYAGPQTSNLKWSYNTGGSTANNGPSIATDRTVYIGSSDKNLYAVNPDGTLKWTYTTGGTPSGTPAIAADGTFYFGCGDKKLYALNPDGTLKWSYTTGGKILGSPTIGSDGTIYVTAQDKILYAVNPDGTLKWKYTTGSYFYWTTPVIGSDGTIYVGNVDKNLYAINPDGTLKWSYTAGDKIYGSAAIGSDGTLYIGSNDNKVYAVNPDGTLKWSCATGGSYLYGTPAIATDRTIYVTNNGGSLYAVNPDGTLKWSYATGSNIQSSPVIGSDGIVYVGSFDAKLYAINPDGTLKWSYATGSNIYGTAAIDSDGTLYIRSGDGKLYAFHDPISVTPVAGFTATPLTGAAPLAVTFTDASTNTPTSWVWDFGDGSTSTEKSPSHTYSSAGLYTVNLTATNSAGSHSIVKSNYIAATGLLPGNRHIFINVANDNGVKYNIDGSAYSGPNNTYYIKADGGGLNELHLTNDPAVAAGQVTASTAKSGAFYFSNTGGRGFDNDIILLVSVKGPIPDDFAVRIRSSGYNWTAAAPGAYNPSAPTDYSYVSGAIDETFTKADFIYGPHVYKPGPGTLGTWSLPLYYGQDTADSSTAEYLMFVDLKAGNLYPTKFSGVSLTDGGDVKVEYSFTNLTTTAAFNGYGWCTASNQGQGITWTHPTSGSTASGYTVTPLTVTAPVAAFTSSTPSGTAPLAVMFNDTSSNSPTSWAWDFNNDGIVDAATQNATYTYITAGTYSVNLTATNSAGSNSILKSGYISVTPSTLAPVASYTASTTTGTAPLAVQFNDTSVNTPTSWLWDFGDGSTSTEQNATHTFTTAGTYAVNLTATNAAGSSSHKIADYITASAAPVLPPVVNFIADNRTGDSPLHVQFNDTSTNSPTSWAWDFQNDGVIDSTEQNATFTYTIPGTYQVNLTASNAGGSAFRLKGNYITVSGENPNLPGTDFTGSVRSGYAPLTVQFNDTSTNTPTSWTWDFQNDGVIDSTVQNASFTYTTPGTFQVNFTATNAAGSKSRLKANYITVNAAPVSIPVAAFSASVTSGTVPLAVQFNDTSSNTPTSWLWDFGDGSTSAIQNATHTYTTAGTYNVNLTVTNAGGSNSLARTGYITAGSAGGVLPGYNNIFVGVANDAGAQYNSFGNNTYNIRFEGVDRGLNALHISTDPAVNFGQVTKTSAQSGTFYATDSGGKGYEDEVILMVATNGTIPDNFSLRITSDGYTWTPNTLSNTAPDLSTVTYRPVALDETFTKADFIYGPQTWKPTGNEVDYPIAYGQNMADTTNTFRVMFIDLNSGVLRPNTALKNNGAVRINYTIQNPGSLTAFNVYAYCKYSNNGNEMVAWGNALVEPKAVSGYSVYRAVSPTASFEANTTTASLLSPVLFFDKSTGSPTSWSWDFGDGSTSTEQNPVHAYSKAGTYTVTLTVANSAGSNLATKTSYITVSSAVPAPVTAFSGTPLSGPAPLSVQFTDTSINTPTGWLWDFGDGSTSVEKSPSHTYTTVGTYSVNLTAMNAAGSNSQKITNYITVTSAAVPPVSAFSANTTAGPAPLTVMFHDDSTGEPVEWLWDFGDGSTSNHQDILHTYTTTGNYTVNLTVTNTAGSSSRRIEKFVVVSPAVTPTPTLTPTPTPTQPVVEPVAAFKANKTVGDRPMTVKFTDTSTNVPTTWAWDFGDGITSADQHPVHQYTTVGNYTVSLKATNAVGNNTMTKLLYIVVIAPVVEENKFVVSEVKTVINAGVQNVTIDTTGANVTKSGNVVTIRNTTSWSSLAITLAANTTETSGTAVNGTVDMVKAVTEPVTAPIESVGSPTVQIALNMSQMPGTTATITQTITKDPDTTAQTSFSLFASSEGKKIDEIAYTLNIEKSGLANHGDGGVIQSATLTMTVSKIWADAHGGTASLAVLRRAEDGTTQILIPQVTGPDASGNYVLTIISPSGLSVFSLASVSAVSSGSSGSAASYSNSYSSSDSGSYTSVSSPLKSSAQLAPPDPNAGPWTTQSINGPTHITQIEIQPIGTFKDLFILTEKPDSLPKEIPSPGLPVYELHKIDLYHATSDDINQAKIEFTVSQSYLDSQKMTYRDVQLIRYHNKEWERLQTEYVGKKDGEHLYKAKTAGFSYFATVLVKDATTVTVTTAPTPAIRQQVSATPAALSTQGTVAPTAARTQAAPPAVETPKSSGPALLVYVFAIAAIVVLSLGIVTARKWWIRKQNPSLFRDEPFFGKRRR